MLVRLKIEGRYISPGSPWENGYAESFHSKLMDEFLSREQFTSVNQARCLTLAWREDYNHERPHSSLGYLTPAEYARQCVVRPGFAGTFGVSTALRPAAQSSSSPQPELS